MSRQPAVAAPHDDAGEAWDRMHALHVDHLVVVQGDRIAGVVSRHDLGGPRGGTHRRMGRRVGEVMRRDIVTVTPGTDVRRAASMMRRHAVGCLPVVERGLLVGIVTVSHLLALLEHDGERL